MRFKFALSKSGAAGIFDKLSNRFFPMTYRLALAEINTWNQNPTLADTFFSVAVLAKTGNGFYVCDEEGKL